MTEAHVPNRYEPIALSNESTVVAEFVCPDEVREERHQSQAELERSFIERPKGQAFQHCNRTSTRLPLICWALFPTSSQNAGFDHFEEEGGVKSRKSPAKQKGHLRLDGL
jgi:hypothetical protein